MTSLRPLLGGVLLVASVGAVGPVVAAGSSGPPRPSTAPAPVRHVVKRGETLYSIARAYGVPLDRLAAANGIDDPSRVRAGARLVIPGGRSRPRTRKSGPPPLPAARKSSPAAPRLAWLTAPLPWPVEGVVISPFMKPRRGHHHAGIDIKSVEGAPVRAVADGVVTQVEERFGNYGRLVVVEHENGMVSYYGHNKKNLVAPGQTVTAEEVIALVGRSGNATCDHLHFELRADGRPIDPIAALATAPPPGASEAAIAAAARRAGPDAEADARR